MNSRYYISLLVLLLCFVIGARADNVVSLSSASGAPGTEVTVSVSMTNTDAVSTLQLSVPLNEELSLVANSAVAGNRLSDHSVTAGVKDGVLNIVVYSQHMTAISGNSGEVLSFRLLVGDTPSDIALIPSKLLLVGTNGQEKTGSTVDGSVSIRCAKAQYGAMTVDFGSVPIMSSYSRTVSITNIGNEPLTVTGISFSETTFSTTTTFPLVVNAGQSTNLNVTYAPVERGNVNAQMQVVCNSISKLNTIQLTAQPFAVNEIHVGDVSGISDEIVTIPLSMNNMDGIIGFQIEFQLPDALEYVDDSFELSERADGHQAVATIQNGLLRILAYSAQGKAFKGNDGVIGSFQVRLVGRYGVSVQPSTDILSAIIGGKTLNVLSDDYAGWVTIQSPQIYANNSLSFGDQPITGSVEQTYTIWNYGSAPLTISRIQFDDERFSVSETLPLVINSGYRSTITVVNNSLTAGAFSGTMQIYSNDPDQRLLTANITGRVIVPNYLAFTAADIFTDEDAALTIEMDNYDAISGIQFDITSTDAFTIDASKVELETRAEGLNLTIQQVGENTLRLVGYTMNGGIASGSGKLMTVYLTPVGELLEGSHQLTMSNMLLGGSDLSNKYEGPAEQSVSYSAQPFIAGDANGDGTVNVLDVVITVNYILSNGPTGFVFRAADMNHDNKIVVTDVVGIVNVILYGNSSNARLRNGLADISNDKLDLYRNEDNSVSLFLDNRGGYLAAQFDVTLAGTQSITDISMNMSRSAGHQIAYSEIAPNVYRVVIYGMSNKVFRGEQGELVKISLTDSSSQDVQIDNIIFTTDRQTSREFAPLKAATTGIEEKMAGCAFDIYTVSGNLVKKQATTTEGLKKGIYVINKQKIIVK